MVGAFLIMFWIETLPNCANRLEGYVDQCYKDHLKNKGKVDLVSLLLSEAYRLFFVEWIKPSRQPDELCF